MGGIKRRGWRNGEMEFLYCRLILITLSYIKFFSLDRLQPLTFFLKVIATIFFLT